uniref:LRAT domain-containing protein n=1 Tax=Cyprinus carpio TaxID=7962 RepID=A0A8C1SKQ3_CYPCA
SAPGPESVDLIEIFRGLYQHWAVYVGEGYVIHHCTTLSKMSVPHERVTVKKEKLYVVVSNNDYCINSILDEKYEPRPIQEIVQDAHSLLGKELPYSVLTRHCEHVVTKLRYRKPQSLVTVAVGAGAGLCIGAIAYAVKTRTGNGEERGETESRE